MIRTEFFPVEWTRATPEEAAEEALFRRLGHVAGQEQLPQHLVQLLAAGITVTINCVVQTISEYKSAKVTHNNKQEYILYINVK